MTGNTPLNTENYDLHREDWDSYAQLYDDFKWDIPDTLNIATYVCERWSNYKDKVAVFSMDEDKGEEIYTFWELEKQTNQLANYLTSLGVAKGDRVGVNVPQKPEAILSHIAIWKIGAVSVPLSTMFGTDGIRYRLDDCSATACIVDVTNIETFRAVRHDVPSLESVLTIGDVDPKAGETGLRDSLSDYATTFESRTTKSDDTAFIAYTSGTTGDPKGVVHAHKALLGHLPFFIMSFCNLELADSDVFWTPSEWAWIGTLFTMVMPALFYGKPVLAYHNDGPLDSGRCLELFEEYGITGALLHPTVLRMLRQVEDPSNEYRLDQVRSVVTGGEEVGEALSEWTMETFRKANLHEAYGQTEANACVTECEALDVQQIGACGKPVPGHEIAILGPESDVPIDEPGSVGEIAIRYEGNPVCMQSYWNLEEKTREKIRNGWLCTEDFGALDENGYLIYHSRIDNVIISSGRRIGPGEIENCLAQHSEVLEVAVVGVPDMERGRVPKAYVVLVNHQDGTEHLKEELRAYAQERLARYEYPHKIEFADELPKTATGKIQYSELQNE